MSSAGATPYEPIRCRDCGVVVEPDLTFAGQKARSYETCVYRCKCGAGYSNARHSRDRRRITKSPALNVPAEVGHRLDDVLALAVNVRNRPEKLAKFCSESSEDAVTWTIFRYLARHHQLARLLPPREVPATKPSLLLWGVPISGPQAASVAAELACVPELLGERTDGRSEPDVIVAFGRTIAVIEAKLGSDNDLQFDVRKFERYVDKSFFAVPVEEVAKLGYYELVRNWRIGAELANRLGANEFLLINLGPHALSSDVERLRLQLAETSTCRFLHRGWRDLLREDDEPWLRAYATDKRLFER